LELVPVVRADGAFQQGLTENQIRAVCLGSFGPDVVPSRAVELAGGTFNTVYRLEFDDREPLVLRVAPDDDRLSPADRVAHGMRNSHAAEPFFVAAGVVVPRVVRADFTHDIVGRDYLIQAVVTGTPADTKRAAWSDEQLRSFYQSLGELTRTVHTVRGPHFGRIAGPHFRTWSEAIEFQLSALVIELDQAGLPGSDLRHVVSHLQAERSVLDTVVEPRLLHNDLWTLNVMVDDDDATPRITGVLDLDEASWGDPLADWPLEQARLRAGTTADAFWEGYGVTAVDPEALRRGLFYRARMLVGSRLDIHRRGLDLDSIPPKFWDLVPVLALLDE
jgi:aminoglycoside phosphotransferase (APT) family kinase protein